MKIILNVLTLTVWQGSLYLIPLIITPYLARCLGVENFGVLGLAAAIISYVSLVIDWGFSLSATRRAAQSIGDPAELRRLFWDIVLAKLILAALTVVPLVGFLYAMNYRGELIATVVVQLLPVLVGVLSANWFLQGLERMASFAFASLFGRLLTIPLTFLFVREPGDVVFAGAISGVGVLVSTVASLYAASRIVPLWPVHTSLSRGWMHLKESFNLFISTAGISLYSQSNILIIAAITSVAEVGIYSGADKIRRAITGLTGPVSTALFPRVNNMIVTNPARAKKLVTIIFFVQGGGTLVLSLAQYIFAEPMVRLFLGLDFASAVPVVKALAPIPFAVGLSNVLGMQMLVPLGLSSVYTRIVAVSGIFNVILLPILCYGYAAFGAAIALTITEIAVTVMMAVALFRRRESLFAAVSKT